MRHDRSGEGQPHHAGPPRGRWRHRAIGARRAAKATASRRVAPPRLWRLWGWVWVCLGLSMVTRAAWAKEEEGYLPVHVCVRPPYLNMDVIVWSYYASTTKFIYVLPANYTTKRYERPTYLYDPKAPPENTKLLPREEDRNRPCDPEPPPLPKEEPKPKKEEPRKASPAPAREDEKKEEPSARSTPPVRPKTPEEEGRQRAWRSKDGVTKDWMRSVLPQHEARQDRTVLRQADKNDPSTTVLPYTTLLPREAKLLPTKRRDDRCAWVLPWPGQKALDRAEVCPGKGDGDGDGTKAGVKKTWEDKVAENLAYMAGGINLQFDEDLKRPDGKQYGVMGGRNPDGPNNPFMQAVASGVMIAAAVLSPKADKLFKRLLPSGKKAAPLLMKEMEEVGHGVAEELARKLGPQHGGELEVRRYLADALQQKGAIGPYEVMKQFTDTLGGQWQAHHIIEKKVVRDLGLGSAEKVPAVILTEAEHKAMTARLAVEMRGAKTLQQVWKAYQRAYAEHPDWLAAIRSYFVKAK